MATILDNGLKLVIDRMSGEELGEDIENLGEEEREFINESEWV